jgi:PEP-CTERM motif
VPVYEVGGTEVATSLDALAAGSFLNGIDLDQFGNSGNSTFWTGSTADLMAAANPLGGSDTTWGCGTSFDFASESSGNSAALIAVSAEINLPNNVPEPASAAVLAVGAGLISVMRRRRRVA